MSCWRTIELPTTMERFFVAQSWQSTSERTNEHRSLVISSLIGCWLVAIMTVMHADRCKIVPKLELRKRITWHDLHRREGKGGSLPQNRKAIDPTNESINQTKSIPSINKSIKRLRAHPRLPCCSVLFCSVPLARSKERTNDDTFLAGFCSRSMHSGPFVCLFLVSHRFVLGFSLAPFLLGFGLPRPFSFGFCFGLVAVGSVRFAADSATNERYFFEREMDDLVFWDSTTDVDGADEIHARLPFVVC
jgi:hypothetical protein